MPMPDWINVVPGSPLASILFWVVALSLVLYLARPSAHRLVLSLTLVVHHGLRLAAHSLERGQQRLARRNREVLLTAGQEAAERVVEREFQRIEASVQRDLAEYPALERQLSEDVARLEEDYHQSTAVPPEVPGWANAVEAIANIPTPRDPAVANVLDTIHGSMVKAQEKALKVYRDDSRHRHGALKRMMPRWRRAQKTLEQMSEKLDSLLTRSRSIDRHMEHYDQIVKGTDRAEQLLSSSSLTQFFIAGLVLAVAIGAAIINFNLIARPMQEMVGGNVYLMGFRTADIAALVIILVEIALGLFLMEALRVTQLFPVIGAMDDKMRVRMRWATFIMLLGLATVEAGLAYMRELLAQDDAALVAGLLSEGTGAAQRSEGDSRWITTGAQMGIGFILPFALTLVAIPLESFVQSSRTVLGTLAVGLLRVLAFALRLTGNLFRQLGRAFVNLYDLLIFLPLWIEAQIKARTQKRESRADDDDGAEELVTTEGMQ